MILNKEKFKCNTVELLMLAASIVFLIGIHSWFSVCPVNNEMIMSCHWAGEMLKVLSVLFVVMAVVHMIVADPKMKLGMDIPLLGVGLVTAFIPGGIISVCQNAEMACRQATKTWTVILCAVLLICILVDIIFYASFLSRQKHQRKVKE